MTVDVSAIAPWVAILLAAASFLHTIFRGQSKDTAEKFGQTDLRIGVVAGKLDLLEDRVTIVENDFKHLPDKDVTHRLELSIGEMRTEMRGLVERIKPIGAMADRIQEAMVEKVMS